jgi:hypothetical protein
MRRTAGADLQRLHAGAVVGPAGTLFPQPELTPDQHQILSDLGLSA